MEWIWYTRRELYLIYHSTAGCYRVQQCLQQYGSYTVRFCCSISHMQQNLMYHTRRVLQYQQYYNIIIQNRTGTQCTSRPKQIHPPCTQWSTSHIRNKTGTEYTLLQRMQNTRPECNKYPRTLDAPFGLSMPNTVHVQV